MAHDYLDGKEEASNLQQNCWEQDEYAPHNNAALNVNGVNE